ncbi:MAG: HAD family hydrolase [Oscillospiraceae bacterium]
MVSGVLFDMDGVLFDTERLAGEADVEAAAEMGYALPDDVRYSLMGLGADAVRETICSAMGPGFDYARFITRMRAHMAREIEAHGLPKKPGVDEALAWLQVQGLPVAVASSSRYTTICGHLQRAGLQGAFSAIVSGDRVEHAKPAPDIFLGAAAALGLPPQRCLAVEDSYNGVRSAAAAGCITVMVPDLLPATEEMRALCAAVLPSLHALPGFVAQCNAGV